jgi:hypothetical protein
LLGTFLLACPAQEAVLCPVCQCLCFDDSAHPGGSLRACLRACLTPGAEPSVESCCHWAPWPLLQHIMCCNSE